MKFALGTAQFGSDYGISNKTGIVPVHEAKRIIEYAFLNGIDTLDTARNYGESESIIGSCKYRPSQIITKLSAIPVECVNVGEWVEKEVFTSLQNLSISKIYGILLHRPSDLLRAGGTDLYEILLSLKRSGIISKFGISVYSREEYLMYCDNFELDIVQAPLNIFDRRFELSGTLKELKERGIDFYARSIFLQGLLLLSFSEIPTKMQNWSNVFQCWKSWLISENICPLEACVRFVTNVPFVHRVIVGVTSLEELNFLLNLNSRPLDSLPKLPNFDPSILDPSQWRNL